MVNGRRTRPAALLLDAMVVSVFVLDLFGKDERFGEEARAKTDLESESKDKSTVAARSKKQENEKQLGKVLLKHQQYHMMNKLFPE